MNRKLMLTTILTATLLSSVAHARKPFLPATSFTQRVVQQVHKRMNKQLDQIYRGLTKGSVTFSEARSLLTEQGRVERKLKSALYDGRIRPREARRLQRAQDRARRHIRSAKRNARARYTRTWRRPSPLPIVRPNPLQRAPHKRTSKRIMTQPKRPKLRPSI
jgi:hypothetical protein